MVRLSLIVYSRIMEITKELIESKIKDGSFSDWHTTNQESGNLDKRELVLFINQLVLEGKITKPNITPWGSHVSITWF